jgi:hypothetical protein
MNKYLEGLVSAIDGIPPDQALAGMQEAMEGLAARANSGDIGARMVIEVVQAMEGAFHTLDVRDTEIEGLKRRLQAAERDQVKDRLSKMRHEASMAALPACVSDQRSVPTIVQLARVIGAEYAEQVQNAEAGGESMDDDKDS